MVNALKSLSVMEMRKRTSQVAAPGRMFRNLADELSKLAVGTSAVVPSARGRLVPDCQPGWGAAAGPAPRPAGTRVWGTNLEPSWFHFTVMLHARSCSS